MEREFYDFLVSFAKKRDIINGTSLFSKYMKLSISLDSLNKKLSKIMSNENLDDQGYELNFLLNEIDKTKGELEFIDESDALLDMERCIQRLLSNPSDMYRCCIEAHNYNINVPASYDDLIEVSKFLEKHPEIIDYDEITKLKDIIGVNTDNSEIFYDCFCTLLEIFKANGISGLNDLIYLNDIFNSSCFYSDEFSLLPLYRIIGEKCDLSNVLINATKEENPYVEIPELLYGIGLGMPGVFLEIENSSFVLKSSSDVKEDLTNAYRYVSELLDIEFEDDKSLFLETMESMLLEPKKIKKEKVKMM